MSEVIQLSNWLDDYYKIFCTSVDWGWGLKCPLFFKVVTFILCVGGLLSSDITFSWLPFPPIAFSSIIMKHMKTIFRNYNILKFCFAALTSYLLYQEFYVFLVEKPTYTSSAKLKIGLNGLLEFKPSFWKSQPKIFWLFQSQTTILTSPCAHSHLSTNNTSCFMATGQALSMPRYRCTLCKYIYLSVYNPRTVV